MGKEELLHALRSKNNWIVLGVLAVAASLGVGVAVATVTSSVLSDTHPAGGPASEVRLRVVRSEFVPSADQPTFSSGWHTHPGPVIFQVQEGRFKITQGPPCHTTTLGPGETYIETPEFPVLARAKQAAKWTTSFILAANKPLLSPANDPCPTDDEDDWEKGLRTSAAIQGWETGPWIAARQLHGFDRIAFSPRCCRFAARGNDEAVSTCGQSVFPSTTTGEILNPGYGSAIV